MTAERVIQLKPLIDARRMADAATFEQKVAAAQAILRDAEADLRAANEAVTSAELDAHDCRIIRSQIGFVEHITTECCYDESGCSAGAGAAPLISGKAVK